LFCTKTLYHNNVRRLLFKQTTTHIPNYHAYPLECESVDISGYTMSSVGACRLSWPVFPSLETTMDLPVLGGTFYMYDFPFHQYDFPFHQYDFPFHQFNFSLHLGHHVVASFITIDEKLQTMTQHAFLHCM